MNPEQQIRFNLVMSYVQKGTDVPSTAELDRLVKYILQGGNIVPVSGFTVANG